MIHWKFRVTKCVIANFLPSIFSVKLTAAALNKTMPILNTKHAHI